MKIEVQNLIYSYHPGMEHEIRALDDISFIIESGSFVGIIGRTGSGKSTLIQHLNGLLKPSSGKILLDDVNLSEQGICMAEIRRKIGLVFQYPEYQLFEETVEKDIAFGPKNMGLKDDEIRVRVREAMETVGLEYERYASRSPFELSGGQKRRAAIAGVIAMRPEVLVLDEPAAGLDPGSHREMLEMIGRFHRKKKCTVILISHNMDDVAEYCGQILVMDKGKLVASGTPREVFSHHRELEKTGLGLPSGAELMRLLEKRGASVGDRSVLTDEEAVAAVLKWLGKQRNG